MSAEQENEQMRTSPQLEDDVPAETLTDLIDRMDREAFRRMLEQSDLSILSTTLRVQR